MVKAVRILPVRASSAVPLLLVVAWTTVACAAEPDSKRSASRPATTDPAPETKETLEDRLQAVRASLDAARNESTDFAATAARLREARTLIFQIGKEAGGPGRWPEFGITDLMVRVDRDWRTLVQERMPAEAYRWLRSAARSRSEGPEAGTSEEARKYFFQKAQRDLFDHLARAFVTEADASDLNRYLRAAPSDLTEVERSRAKRLAEMRKALA